MLPVVLVLVLLAAGAGAWYWQRTRAAAKAGPSSAAMDELRARVLESAPEDHNLSVNSAVWGVVVEFVAKGAPVLVVGFSSGVGTVYSTKGVGIVGGSADPAWARIAELLCQKAEGALGEFTKVKALTGPAPGNVRIHVLTVDGIRARELTPDDVRNDRHKLAPVNELARRLLTTILEKTG